MPLGEIRIGPLFPTHRMTTAFVNGSADAGSTDAIEKSTEYIAAVYQDGSAKNVAGVYEAVPACSNSQRSVMKPSLCRVWLMLLTVTC